MSKKINHILSIFLVGCSVYQVYNIRKVHQGIGTFYQGPESIVVKSLTNSVPSFYLPVSINGHEPSWMLVDTGATYLSLSRGDAKRFGIVGNEPIETLTGNGTIVARKTSIDHVRVGHMSEYHVEAVVLPSDNDISVLGMSFLSRAGTLVMRDHVLEIHPEKK